MTGNGKLTRRVLLALPFALSCCARGAATQPRGATTMSHANAESQSVILRASHILRIRLETVRPTPWRQGSAGWNEREVAADAVIEEVLKGDIAMALSGRVDVRIKQYQDPSPMFLPVPGLWSDLPVESDMSFIVFALADNATPPPVTLLTEPVALAVFASDTEAEGIRLALRHAAGELDAAAFLHAAAGIVLGLTFVSYLEAVLSAPAFAAPEAFAALLSLFPAARAAVPVRATLLSTVINGVRGGPAFGDRHYNALVAALLRFGILGQAGPLQENLLTVDLPAMVGLRGGEPRAASAVFNGDAATRATLLEALRRQPTIPGAAPLVVWLEAP